MSGLYSKFVIKEKKDDVVHSSGYGVAQTGGAMGASSNVGFSERMRINNNRSRVKRYGDSKIANQFQSNYTGASTYSKTSDNKADGGVGGIGGASKYSDRREQIGADTGKANGASKYSTLRQGASSGAGGVGGSGGSGGLSGGLNGGRTQMFSRGSGAK